MQPSKKFKIGNTIISNKHPSYIIAEIGGSIQIKK